MSTKDTSPEVIIHCAPPKSSGEFRPRGTIYRIAQELGRLGLRVMFTRGVKDYNQMPKNGIISVWGIGGQERMSTEVENLRVIRDYNGSLASHPSPITNTLDGNGVAILNGPSVRSLDNKLKAAQLGIFGGWMVKTTLIPQGVSDEVLCGIMEGKPHFFKPVRGHGGRGVVCGGPEVGEFIRASQEDYVMQPVIDSSMPFPGRITYLDEASSRLAQTASHWHKEVRIFWFYGSGKFGWLPTARFFNAETTDSSGRSQLGDKYAYPDPDTIPEELIKASRCFCKNIARHTKQTEISGAFDFVFGRTGNEDPRWLVGEGNFWQPVPPKHEELNRLFVSLTTEQIERIVKSKSKSEDKG